MISSPAIKSKKPVDETGFDATQVKKSDYISFDNHSLP